VAVTLDKTSQHTARGAPVALVQAPTHPVSQQTAVAELGQAALSGLEVDEVFSLAVDLTCEVLGVDYAKILQQRALGEPLILVAGRGWADDVRVGETTVSCERKSQAGYTLMSTEPVLVEDLAHEERFSAPSLLVDHGVVSGMSVIIPDGDRPFGVLGVHTRRRRRFTPDDGDFLRSVANIIGGAIQSARARQQIQLHSILQERRLRYQAALSMCAQSLLSSTGDARLEHAVEALLTATEATYVFVERNVVDPELGFSSKNVVEIEHAETSETDDEYWDLVPWRRMPTSQRHLERGEPFVFLPEELEGAEYELYAASPFPIKSELDIPIFVEGEWAGLIAFADKSAVREWTEEDLSLLTTAATMIGAFWEREIDRERREQVIRSKDDFLASVSHELRTPLTAVLGFGQILQDEAGSLSAEERSELVETVVRQATDLTNIVSDLLVAAKSDTGTLHVTQVPVNLRAQTAQALEAFEYEQVSHIALVGHSVRAAGDPHRVRQIVRNLISNALRYGGDTIRVEVSSDTTTANVLVCDNGSPIPARDRERIFEQYQRAHNAPGLAESLGLGLAISRQLARRMGGDLTYRHEGGEAIFELTLPKAD
jgi:signal transduction histidine kinase